MQPSKSDSGTPLVVKHASHNGVLELRLSPVRPTDAVLHWGLRRASSPEWKQPPSDSLPTGSIPFGQNAVRTPLTGRTEADPFVLRLEERHAFDAFEFVLHHPSGDQWENDRGRNFRVELPRSIHNRTPLEVARPIAGHGNILVERTIELTNGSLAVVAVRQDSGLARIALATDRPGHLLAHWGLATHGRDRWNAPALGASPAQTTIVDDHAARTPFDCDAGFQTLVIEVPTTHVGLSLVLYDAAEDRWFKDRGKDIFVSTSLSSDGEVPANLASLAQTIVDHETSRNSWTLMHRFNLAHDLIQDLGDNDGDALALIFVWLRFSALRQLDWQRNYNTKPRELSHAQDRLTGLVAAKHNHHVRLRDFSRRILATVGRGGEGQRVRDEILQIMHRHHVKEVSGKFLEQWHQKLHNNTTPDDIVICRAYLAFLEHHGDLDTFYSTLQAGGVSRERLRSFERPIVTDPDFVPQIRDGLLHDFNAFLRTLKSVHDAVDLESALHAANHALDPNLRELAWGIWNKRHASEPIALARDITHVRSRLASASSDDGRARDLLSLDVALEDFLRVTLERNADLRDEPRTLIALIPIVLENLALCSTTDGELAACIALWNRVNDEDAGDPIAALRTLAAVDRASRTIAANVDALYQALQPKAEHLGQAFGAERWTVQLFSEEVVRGRLEFVAAMLVRRLDSILRQETKARACDIVSRGSGSARGRVVTCPQLLSVQTMAFDEPVIVIAEHVSGEEELPAAVVAVLSRDSVDLVSHVAVRARNTGLLMVTLHEETRFREASSWVDQTVGLRLTTSGDLVRDDSVELPDAKRKTRALRSSAPIAGFKAFALPLAHIDSSTAGGKSNQLRALLGAVPDWVRIPSSCVVPFAVFDEVVSRNAEQRRVLEAAALFLARASISDLPAASKSIRDAVLAFPALPALLAELRCVAGTCGLSWPDRDDGVWVSLKQVWASKWNDRAVLNRRTHGMPDEQLHMAVLVQEVAEAEYSFVLHTVDPATGDAGWGYGEVVMGLGEVLVGNHPGRALGFAWNKKTSEVRIVSMPSKRVALRGGGLMFRSDSNGEDLAEHAGAGLYDSVQLPPPSSGIVDYAREPLLWNESFRDWLLGKLAQIGQHLERVLGRPQDIEGTFGNERFTVVQSRPQVGTGT